MSRQNDGNRKLKIKRAAVKWTARPAVDGCAQQRGVVCDFITCLCALFGFRGVRNSPEERAAKRSVFTSCQFGVNDPAL